MKKVLSVARVLALYLGLSVPVFAASTTFLQQQGSRFSCRKERSRRLTANEFLL